MSEALQTICTLLLIVAAAVLVVLIIRTVLEFINRKRKSEIAQLREEKAVIRAKLTLSQTRCADLYSENIVLRGLNLALDAENKDLHGENHELQEGRTVIHIRGRKIEVL